MEKSISEVFQKKERREYKSPPRYQYVEADMPPSSTFINFQMRPVLAPTIDAGDSKRIIREMQSKSVAIIHDHSLTQSPRCQRGI